MKKKDKFEIIVKLFAKNMFYGDWEWETPNERLIEMLMREVGLYPFTDEDEMMFTTKVDESLYTKSKETIPIRN